MGKNHQGWTHGGISPVIKSYRRRVALQVPRSVAILQLPGTTVLESLWRFEEMIIESDWYWEALQPDQDLWMMSSWKAQDVVCHGCLKLVSCAKAAVPWVKTKLLPKNCQNRQMDINSLAILLEDQGRGHPGASVIARMRTLPCLPLLQWCWRTAYLWHGSGISGSQVPTSS